MDGNPLLDFIDVSFVIVTGVSGVVNSKGLSTLSNRRNITQIENLL